VSRDAADVLAALELAVCGKSSRREASRHQRCRVGRSTRPRRPAYPCRADCRAGERQNVRRSAVVGRREVGAGGVGGCSDPVRVGERQMRSRARRDGGQSRAARCPWP